MRYHDDDEAQRFNAEPWQIELLKANPSYCSWGPHEDYMTKQGENWDSRVIVPTWKEFGPWELNDLNECANFYFEVSRASKDCTTCGGNGYHPDAQWVSQSFYSHSSPFKHQTEREIQAAAVMARFGAKPHELLGHDVYPSDELLSRYGLAFKEFCERMRTRGHWDDDITEDEAVALIETGRADRGETAESINAKNAPGARGFGSHDAINRFTLIEARLKRLGIPKDCPECEGHGYVYTAPAAHVSLVLWWLHPRKGCSRGIEVERIEQADLPAIKTFLTEAAQRNAQRFSGVGLISTAA